MMFKSTPSFHGYLDSDVYRFRPGWPWPRPIHISYIERTLSYSWKPYFHPYVTQLVQRLVRKSVPGLLGADIEYVTNPDGTTQKLPDGTPRPVLYEDIFTPTQYEPGADVSQPYPVKELDFSTGGPYALYNWELFYHAPLLIALHLSQNQQYADAQRWFHYIFDPTDNSNGPTPARFWKVRPFQTTDVELIEEILVNLATGADAALQQETIESISAWKSNPFRPHAVARFRPSAYMFKAVMAYLDNLIAWGDSLFQQDTRETINEAMQLYVLAANILGPRPQAVPKKGSIRPQTYANLRADLDAFGDALSDFETDIPFDTGPQPNGDAQSGQLNALSSIGRALYFCVPRNDRLLAYWDTVADRLFKIRNSLNFEGVFRQLALFAPPIDPGLLAKAAASGLDVAAVVNGLNQPLPLVRFSFLVGKAAEIAQEVKQLGTDLLAAIEKQDNEALAVLRARHETNALSLAETVKYQAWQEAVKTRENLEASLDNAFQRYRYYERLLGRADSDIELPSLDDLDHDGLTNFRFHNVEPTVALRDISVNVAQDPGNEAPNVQLIPEELTDLTKLDDAQNKRDTASSLDKVGGALAVIPTFGGNIEPFGCGVTISFGGSNLAALMSFISSFYKADADKDTFAAGKTAKLGVYARREQDWSMQSNAAAGEMNALYKQIRAAQIRESITEREWKNHQVDIAQAQAIERFLTDEKTGKTTNVGFYAWMRREVKALYGSVFQLAFDVAKKAERALQHELGDATLGFIQPTYLSGKEGLLAGEKLLADVRQMEMAYHELNRREYELTKHVSLQTSAPLALLQLRATGSCVVTLPEELFDLDAPGHYFRRIRSVSVSIPCVSGPYTSVNCTLTLRKSTVRTSALLSGSDYARTGADDARFSDHFAGSEAIVTSTGREDDGLFDAGGDNRLRPFERAGAISEWQLTLPDDLRQFDYGTISDVILHLRYTAREGGAPLRDGAVANLQQQIDAATSVGSLRLFSIRHEFPTDWARFKNVTIGGATARAPLTLTLRPEHYPYWSEGHLAAVKALQLFADSPGAASIRVDDKADGSGNHDSLAPDANYGAMLTGALVNVAKPAPTGSFTLWLDSNAMDDLWMAVSWGKN